MNTNQLKYFLSVAKHLNFTEAAKEYFMTQPSISHQISELEIEMGVKLFERSTRNVLLTKSGEIFLEEAKKILDIEEKLKDKFLLMKNEKEQTVKIAYLASPCKHFLPNIIHTFRENYPQVKIELTKYNAGELEESIEKKEHDIYFSLLEDLKKQNTYPSKKVFEDPFCIICRNDHPCLLSSKIDFEKIATEPFLMHEPDTAYSMTKQILQVCRDLNFKPRITNRYSSMEEVLFAAESGIGISILPYNIRDYLVADLAYIPLNHIPTKSIIGVAWNDIIENQAIGCFMEKLNNMLSLQKYQ